MSATTLSHRGEKMDACSRNLKAQCDQLYKELERKELRNDKLQKEVQTMRTSHADMQVGARQSDQRTLHVSCTID
jgi:hypothetical protein